MPNQKKKGITVRADWSGADEVPIEFVNQFMIQHTGQEFILSAGQAIPPSIVSSDPAAQAKFKKITEKGSHPVKVTTRLVMTPRAVNQLITLLQTNVQRYEETSGESEVKKDG